MKKPPRSVPLTRKNIQKLEEQVKIIKVEVRKFNTKLDGVRNKIWLDMENLKHEMKDEMALLRNDVAGMKDEVITEVKAMREEFTVTLGQYKRQEEAFEGHEKRITSLETQKLS